MVASFNEGMARAILESETSHARFERFCCDLLSKVEGRHYVPTSSTYDQGRDARAVDVRRGDIPPIICATTRKDIEEKIREDAQSLAAKGNLPGTVHLCSNLPLTEHRLDQVKALFRRHCPGVAEVLANGTIQLAAEAVRFPECLENLYAGELASVKATLGVTESTDADIQMTGMRIALTTQLADDAHSLREDLQRNIVLTALSDGKPRNLAALCNQVSGLLHLPRAVQPEYLQSALQSLDANGCVVSAPEGYVLTEKGHEEVKRRTDKGLDALVRGQEMIHAVLLDLTGQDLAARELARLWATIQDHIASMFLANGIYITEAMASIVEGQTRMADHPDLHEAIQSLGQTVAELGLWGPRSRDIGQAVTDIFHEKASPAFKWLSDLCIVYVSLCSLGLDSRAQDQMAARLREIDLLLDTDVVLTFLSPGEPDHDAIVAVVNGWRRINGHVYTTPAVLEETAYHAWISEHDYVNTWRNLHAYTDADALRLIENVFVRGFRVESRGQYHPTRWGYYIGMFRGAQPYDYGKLVVLLQEEGVLPLSEEGLEPGFAEAVTKQCRALGPAAERQTEEAAKEVMDKCMRDGRLIAVLLRHRAERNKIGGTAIVVSSSGRLRTACVQFNEQLGSPIPVAPIGAVAYYLALIPGTNMTLGTLRALFFDTGFAAKLGGLDRVVLRAIKASQEYFVPFSRRGSLCVEMRRRIGELAKQRGQKASEIEEGFVRGDKALAQDMATVVAASVDALVRSESEKKIEALRKEVRDLKGRRS